MIALGLYLAIKFMAIMAVLGVAVLAVAIVLGGFS